MEDEKIRVLLIIPTMRAGGAERITYLLAKHLPRTIFKVTLLIVAKAKPFFKIDLVEDLQIVRLNCTNIRSGFWPIRSFLQKEKQSAIISMITHLNTVVSLICRTLTYQPLLYLRETNVLDNLYESNHSWKRKARKILQKYAYHKATGIICQSAFMQNDLVKHLAIPLSRLHIINNPVETPQEHQFDDKEHIDFLAIGNLNPIKGYERLLDIVSCAPQDVRFGIIGDGLLRTKLEEDIRQAGLLHRVILLGYQTNPSSYLGSAKALVMTSHFESFPNVVLEAGILGIPTVAYDVPGGLREIIRHGVTGYLVENDDHEAFCQFLEKVRREPLDEKTISEAIRSAYGLERIMKQYSSLLLGEASPHSEISKA